MAMELRHLRCFLAIAEQGTLTRAATRLHLTQPVVSRTLRRLEDHLGVRLIDRSTHHLGLTRGGVDAALLRGPVTTPGIRTEPLAGADGLTVSLAWTHPPTHPAIARLVTLARDVIGYRPPGAT
jgi:Bacterial regulatory helix-turn-helix protein, lysR family